MAVSTRCYDIAVILLVEKLWEVEASRTAEKDLDACWAMDIGVCSSSGLEQYLSRRFSF